MKHGRLGILEIWGTVILRLSNTASFKSHQPAYFHDRPFFCTGRLALHPQTCNMARRRRERSASDIKLKRPDTTGPSEKTLLELAEQRGLFNKAQERERSIKAKTSTPEASTSEPEPEPLPPFVERIFETLVWTINLSALHFTLDVLVQNQYAAEMSWSKIVGRTGQAFLGMFRSPAF